MKKSLQWLSCLLLAGLPMSVHAQDVWTYQVIGADNQTRISFQPPIDLTYPPEGTPMPVADVSERRGVLLTPQEAAARLRAPKLIIMLIPSQVADRRRYGISP